MAYASEKDLFEVGILNATIPISESTKSVIIAEINKYFESRYPYIEGFSISNNGEVKAVDIFSICLNAIRSKLNESGSIANVTVTAPGYGETDNIVLKKGKRAKANITFSY